MYALQLAVDLSGTSAIIDLIRSYTCKSTPMNLMMYVGNDLIESIPLEKGRISKPGYLGHFKRVLKEKHRDLLSQISDPPEFLVIDPNPRFQEGLSPYKQAS
jgi:hypothetical protein